MLLRHAHRHVRHAYDASSRLLIHGFVIGLAAFVLIFTYLV